MIRFTYDPELVEEAVLLAEVRLPRDGARAFRRERNKIYDIADAERRETRFRSFHMDWFTLMGLGRVIAQTLGERPEISTRLTAGRVVRAVSRSEESADLVDRMIPGAPAPQPILVVRVRPASLVFDRGSAPDPGSVPPPQGFGEARRSSKSEGGARGDPAHPRDPSEFDPDPSHGHAPLRSLADAPCAPRPDALVAFLRHELMHVADMLDPQFGYQRDLPSSDDGPSHDNILRDRYRVVWDVTIDGRLARSGLADDSVRATRWEEFAGTFAMLGARCRHAFEDWFDRKKPTHQALIAFVTQV